MILDSLNIERISYGDDKGRYRGRIKFSTGDNNITLSLPPELSEAFLAFAAKELRRVSAEASDKLHADIMNSTRMIEIPSKDAP